VCLSASLDGVRWQQGCFAQDAVGERWLCLPVKVTEELTVAAKEAVGIDLGLRDAAVTSDGERLEAMRFYRNARGKLGMLPRESVLTVAPSPAPVV
jgi:putative transposase